MAVAFNILRKWSWARDQTNTNYFKWADTPSLSLKQWTDAYQSQQNIKIYKDPDVENKFYFKSGCAAEIESIKKYEQLMTNCLWHLMNFVIVRLVFGELQYQRLM